MEKKTKLSKSWWRVPLLLLACLIGGSSPTWAVMHFKDNTRMSVFHEPTETEPFIGVSVLYYDANDCDSYFTHKKTEGGNPGPAVYVDGKYICSPDNELAWPGGKAEGSEEGNWSGAESACGKDGWYGNTYNHEYCTIRFWNPYHEAKKGNEGYYRTYIEMRIYLKNWNTAQTHTVKIKGWWRLNCNKGEGYEEKVFSNIKGFEDWKNTSITALTTGRSSVTVSGSNLGSKSTNVALYASFGSAPSEYKDVADGCFSKNSNYTTSFSNMTCSVDRNNYKNTLNLPVQLSRTITTGDVSGDMHIYRWFTPNVPGFVYPVDVKCSEPNQWTRKTTLTWTVDAANNRCTEGKWAVRNSTTGEVLSQNVLTYEKRSYEATIDGYNKTNTFEVYFVPTDVSSLPSELKASTSISIKPSFSFNITATDTLTNKISVSWTNTAFGDASPTNKYTVILERSLDESNWSEIARFEIVNDTTKGAYDDTNVQNLTTYYYRVKTTAMGQMFISEPANGVLKGITTIKSFTASRGMFSSMVKLKWEADQIGTSTTYFTIKRKRLDNSTNNVWSEIYSTSGTGAVYSYDDVTAMPGDFYEYSVTPSLLKNDGNIVYGKNVITDGYSRSSGNVSGRITYGTGTAVKDVKVVLTPNDETAGLRSLKLEGGSGTGFSCTTTKEDIQKLFEGDFSIQLYINPDSKVMSDSTRYIVLDANQIFHIGLDYEPSKDRYKLGAWIAGRGASNLYIPANQWSHVTVVHKHATGTTTFYVPVADTLQSSQVWTNKPLAWGDVSKRTANFAIGNYGSLSAPQSNNYSGYIDEFRFFTKALNEEEILHNYNHTLVGNESELAVYYPLDEGIYGQTMAYDFSKTGGVPNGRHARANVSAISSSSTPSSDQLSLMAYTDSLGSYEVNGVPFSGEGISYIITPQLGIHEFSPVYKTVYVSSSSLVHSGVDFEDVSSFPVRGKVFYADTDYPVVGVSLLIDGITCSKDGEPVMTNSLGEYEISVPIGDHFISVSKNKHVFKDGGRYPKDPNGVGLRQTFNSKLENLDFYDETLVNFAGRVVGGNIEGDKPVGFRKSNNNIGITEMVLTPTNETPRMNVEKIEEGTTFRYDTRMVTLPIASDTTSINSRSWRGANDECKMIFIQTDSLTGEFSALLPPLEYKIFRMNVLSNPEIDFGVLPTVNLTDIVSSYSDTLYNDDGTQQLFSYNTLLKQIFHSDPHFNVVQEGQKDGAFGISSYEINDENGKMTVKDIYSKDPVTNVVTYKYGGPVFEMDERYTFNLEAYEEYVNKDANEEVTDHVPLADLIVTINNALSDQQPVYNKDCTVEGNEVKAGEVAELQDNQLPLDSLGRATYTWTAGLPNITYPYTRTITMNYDIEGRPYQWISKDGMPGVVVGSLPTGSNFVTSGPDMVDMILRDPPGTGSSAEWGSGVVTSKSTSNLGTWNSETHLTTTSKLGATIKTATGIGVAKIDDAKSISDLEVGIMINIEGEAGNSWSRSIETMRTISTSDDPGFVGADGDVFIGTATNVVFGKARNLGFHRVGSSEDWELNVDDAITTGLTFGTAFSYTQSHIINTLLPNLESLRNSMLKCVTDTAGHTADGKYPIYVTTIQPDDPRFGLSNYDPVWGDEATKSACPEGPSYRMIVPDETQDYQDSVEWCNNQIDTWKRYLAFNEEEKVKAFENRSQDAKNLSFDGGTSVNESSDMEEEHGSSYEVQVSAGVHLNRAWGVMLNNTGVIFDVGTETSAGYHRTTENSTTNKTHYSYTLAEEGEDALTVDVYEYGAFSPIFRTRAGQTSNPYEGEVRTNFYKKNGDYPIIMEATMQIEVPQIDVDAPIISDIPNGSPANYTIRLGNISEIGADVAYKLFVLNETNPDGALISIDGMPLTEGRLIKVPGNQMLTKSLQLRQTNTSVLDYEGNKVEGHDLYHKGIGIVFASESQPEEIADTIFIKAYYVPSSSPVDLALSNTTINTLTGSDLRLTFSGFDRNYNGLKAFRLQYKRQGATDWTQLKEYVVNASDTTKNNLLLPATGASVTYTLPMAQFSDGNYLFRVVSASTYGTSEVYRYSNEIALTKDMQKPRPLGQPEPADGVLDIGDQLSVTFNEAILKGMLTKEANFKVTGVLNGAEIAHETALSMQNVDVTAQTEADINLIEKDFSIDTWLNISGEGTLLTHGKGTNQLTVETNSEGKLVVTIAGTPYTSDYAIPFGKWSFLTLCYKNNGTDGVISATVAYDEATIDLFKDSGSKSVVKYNGNGPLSVGKQMTGAIHELLLWDEAHDMTTALLNRSKTKSPSTRHLIGYWKMNEGEGTTIRDYARSRNMTMPAETWYMNNVNKAVSLNNSYMTFNVSDMTYCTDDDYAIEFWMRGDAQAKETQLLQAGQIALWTNANGQLQLTTSSAYDPTNENSVATNSPVLTNNAWHHIALNVLRQGAAAVYVDGKRCLTTDAANVGNIATNNIIVGARRITVNPDLANYSYDRAFNGQIDEIRVWNATLNAEKLSGDRKVRLTGKEDGLVAYYPFEMKQLDSGNQVQTVGYANDLVKSGHTAEVWTIAGAPSSIVYTDNAPALRTKPTETNVGYSFTASDNKIVIELNEEEDAAALEGCTINFTVRDVVDENGNNSVSAIWSAFINRKELVWADDELSVELPVETSSSVTATIVNKGGKQQMWTLEGMPSWLKANSEYGTTNPRSESQVTFTISPATPIGKYEETVYLKGNNGIETPLTIKVKVTGEKPLWSVIVGDYEEMMNLIGGLYVLDIQSEDEDDLVGAFIDGECRGVAHPEYDKTFDSFFVTMNIYGNNSEKDKPVEFKAYDASSGIIYPVVKAYTATSTTPQLLETSFDPSNLYGRYNAPVILSATDEIEQNIDLGKGWNWMSFAVKPNVFDVENVFSKVSGKAKMVKSQTNSSEFDDEEWLDGIGDMNNSEMYVVQTGEAFTLSVTGHRVKPDVDVISVNNGWSWVAFNCMSVMSLDDALADMQPNTDEIIKGQRGVAYFDTGTWWGNLKQLAPGLGYKIQGKAARTFSYPTKTAAGARRATSNFSPLTAQPSEFTPVDYHNYPYNMVLIAQVVNDGTAISGAELGIFAGDECREAAITDERGMVYITIPGDNATTLTFRVAIDGETSMVNGQSITYKTDAVIGSPSHPFIINLGEATGIASINGDDSSLSTTYDLQGRKVKTTDQSHKLRKGVYIVDGQKKVK
ncbi:MAG: LamG domain-containing protein [Prevotella sp.]|nr:LamG domain-containing protein [Prevotella sp.]